MNTTLLIIIGLVLVVILSKTTEKLWFPDRYPYFDMSDSWSYMPHHINLGYYYPGKKSLMSRDIRGDPYIPYYSAGPWNQPSGFPIRNRRMYMGW